MNVIEKKHTRGILSDSTYSCLQISASVSLLGANAGSVPALKRVQALVPASDAANV